jgi:glycogen(starch) synthase
MTQRRRRRIALRTNYPPDLRSFGSGVETAAAGLLEGLQAHTGEFEVHLVAVPRGLARDHRVEVGGIQFHFLALPGHPLARPRLPLRVRRAMREIARLEPDLVHCQDNLALGVAAVRSGRAGLFTMHGVKRHEAGKRAGWERASAYADALLEPYVHAHFRDFICISGYAARVLRQSTGRRIRAHAIPNPIRSTFFAIAREPDADPLLLFVGVLDPLKRPLDLIRAHNALRASYPGLRLVLCGEGEPGYVARLRREAGPGIQFAGRQDAAQLAGWLGRATALVLPSAQENAPMTIGEAMAAGVPVVATSVGGVPEMVADGETGFCYDAGDVPALIGRLAHLLRDRPAAEALGRQGRCRARELYAPARVAERTVEVYRAIMGGC